ncbi:hypothetical protein ABNF65_21065 [Paenibacillus larvae]
MFYGYCMDQQGRYPVPVELKDAQEILNYCELQKNFQYEIRIIEPKEDALIVHIVDGNYIYPEEWRRFNKK